MSYFDIIFSIIYDGFKIGTVAIGERQASIFPILSHEIDKSHPAARTAKSPQVELQDGATMETEEGRTVVSALRHVACEVLGASGGLCVES